MTDKQRVYAADAAIPFHKLVINSNSSPELRSRPVTGFQAEVSFSPHKKVDVEGLEERVIDALVRMQLAERDDPVVASSMVTLPYAYPVYTAPTVAARDHLLNDLARQGVYGAGRFGEWLYLNSDDAVLRGKEAAERVNAKGPSRR